MQQEIKEAQNPNIIIIKELRQLREEVKQQESRINELSNQNTKILSWGNELQNRVFNHMNALIEIIESRISDGHLLQESQSLDEKNSRQEIALESFPEFCDI